MNPATECENLFSKAEELGYGIVALGAMLQWASDDVHTGTLAGLGSVLNCVGENIAALNLAFLNKPYRQIVDLQDVEREAHAAQVGPTSPPVRLTNEDIMRIAKEFQALSNKAAV
jgi:hypothetical protein